MKKKQDKKPVTIIVDTRESKPLDFSRLRYVDGIVKEKLDFADYTTEALKQIVVIERKTKADLFSTLGANRKRFIEELDRALSAGVKFFYIVIEDNLDSIYSGNMIWNGRKSFLAKPYGSNIVAQLLSFIMNHKLNIIPIFASNKKTSAKIVSDILIKAEKYFGEKNESNSSSI